MSNSYYDVIPQPARSEYFSKRETVVVEWTGKRYRAVCPLCGAAYHSIYRGDARSMCHRHMVKHYMGVVG